MITRKTKGVQKEANSLSNKSSCEHRWKHKIEVGVAEFLFLPVVGFSQHLHIDRSLIHRKIQIEVAVGRFFIYSNTSTCLR